MDPTLPNSILRPSLLNLWQWPRSHPRWCSTASIFLKNPALSPNSIALSVFEEFQGHGTHECHDHGLGALVLESISYSYQNDMMA